MLAWRKVRSLLAVGCVAMSTACDGGEPPDDEPPAPAVSAEEVVERILAYAERIYAEVPGHSISVATRFQPPEPTCADLPVKGPDWGVVPVRQYDVHLGVGHDPATYVERVMNWLTDNGFAVPSDADVPDTSAAPTIIQTLRATAADGISVSLETHNHLDFSVKLGFRGPCAWPDGRPGGPTPPVLPPMAMPSGPIQAANEEAACEKPETYIYSSESPPYAGPGPHSITVVEFGIDEGLHLSAVYVPPEWEPSTGSEVDRSRIRLVACLTTAEIGESISQVTCEYEQGPAPFAIFEATYQVSVIEAATGRYVASFSLSGTESDQDSCPAAILYGFGDALLRGIDIDDFHAALRPLVEETK